MLFRARFLFYSRKNPKEANIKNKILSISEKI